MPNYQLGKVYELTSIHTNRKYIGSTCEKYLSGRLGGHVSQYKRYLAGKFNNVKSFEILEHGDYQINLLESYPCNNKAELLARERYWIENTENCVNKCIPGRTFAEYYDDNKEQLKLRSRSYHHTHKDQIKAKSATYRASHADAIKAQKGMVTTCDICRIDFTQSNRSRHEKSARHLACVKPAEE